MDEENLALVNMPIKLQTLLHQFIQLYDRLAVEHSLMTERELKLLKRLEKLHETLEHLNKTIEVLNKFGPQVTKTIELTINEVANEIYIKLADSIRRHIEQKLNDSLNRYSLVFKDATNQLEAIAKQKKEDDTVLFWLKLITVALFFLLLGMIVSRYFFTIRY